jgi:16S rRNA G966 N2-methylase RsmD
MNEILHGDCLDELKKLNDDSVDLVCTDPPYGYSFMGKNWDKAVPSVEVWKECLRVLKPGAFAFVMSAPRQDVLSQMIVRIGEAGFDTDFTSIYWTYASGFPKAANIGKMVDKRAGATRPVVRTSRQLIKNSMREMEGRADRLPDTFDYTAPATDAAKKLDGSYGGFQPKPAVEVIIVAMKPLSEKTYVDQALKNGKGITWLDDCRVPTSSDDDIHAKNPHTQNHGTNEVYGTYNGSDVYDANKGRFPANLIVSDDVLNDGRVSKSTKYDNRGADTHGFHDSLRRPKINERIDVGGYADSGSYSRYFDLDAWANTLPFLIVPKASKREKRLDGFACGTIRDVCKGESTEQVALLLKDMFGSVVLSLSIDVSGDNISVRCPTDFTSTIRTTISGIIASKTWSLSMPSLTNASTKGASSKKTAGTSHVAFAKSSSALTTTIGIFQKRVGLATDDVRRAIYASLLKLDDDANWSDAHSTHPTTKPLKLMSYLITLGSRPGDVVLDPFLGSGTTALAAKSLDRRYLGIERESEYVEIARARLKANPQKNESQRSSVPAEKTLVPRSLF